MEKVLKITPVLTDMEVGESAVFPLAKMKSVRVISSELGAILSRKYTTATDRNSRTITVVRTS